MRRRRRYQVLDEHKQVMRAYTALKISEQHQARFVNSKTNLSGTWGQGTNATFTSSVMFDDHIGIGGGDPFWTYQTFAATDQYNVNRALVVIEMNGDVKGIIGIHATDDRENINGNDLLKDGKPAKWCDTPDLVKIGFGIL